MKVIFVGAGPGDPDLLTVKALRLLQNCQCCVYAGSLVSPQVLALLPAAAEKHDSASMNLEQIVAVFCDAREANKDVIRLHTGDPSIYGAVREQMNELDTLGIEYEVVPGVSSFQAAAAALKAELTAPEISQTIILSRAAGRTPVPESQQIDRLAETRSTLCLFLSVAQIGDLAEKLAPYYGQDCPAAVVFHASWPDQRVFLGTLEDIAPKVQTENIGKTAMILVGWALAHDNPASRLYSSRFSHGYRKGADK
jgi:precorrin-4/cobalt-precorrin-4 C11-methyltransferase